MNLLCTSSPLPLTTKPYPSTTKLFSSSSLQCHSSHKSFKSALPFLSAPGRQTQLASSGTSKTAVKAGITPTSPYPLRQTIEHVALFKMKPNTNLDMLIDQLNLLETIPGIMYLSAGRLQDSYYPSPLPSYNVLLHIRLQNQQDDDAYMCYLQKLNFTNTYTEPYYEDCMVMDWVAYHPEPLPNPTLWSAMRLTLFKMDDGGWGPVYEVIEDMYGEGNVNQVTFGQNYVGKTYHPQAKGFELSSVAVFPGVYEMEALGTAKIFRTKLEEKLKPTVSEVIVVDDVVNVLYAE